MIEARIKQNRWYEVKNLLLFMVLIFGIEFVNAKTTRSKNDEVSKGMSRTDYAEYMASCRKMILEAKPDRNIDDVYMLCSDPYLNGKPFETKADKTRRKRLIKESEAAKNEMMGKNVDAEPKFDPADFVKLCKKLLLEQDPGQDPADADMLCTDPYLNGKPNESHDDEVRRKRLIAETNKAKHKMMEKHVVPVDSNSKNINGSNQ